MLINASDWDGGWEYIVAAIVVVVVRRLRVVFVRIKTRAGRAGVYLKAIDTCAMNFPSMGIFRQWVFCRHGNFLPWEFSAMRLISSICRFAILA